MLTSAIIYFKTVTCIDLKFARKTRDNILQNISDNQIWISGHNVTSMRIDYNLGRRLDTEQLAAKDPIGLFEIWFELAKDTEGIGEANAMTLATATRSGIPSARILLLKGFDKRGFQFFTNYESRKGQELEENPNAALVFFWQPLQRQVRIEGPVTKLTDKESTEYFHSRPFGSQIGAGVSHQSLAIPNRQVLIDKEKELTEKYAGYERIPKPNYWGGYRVIPKTVEFWQGRSNRLHDRILFRRANELSTNESNPADACWTDGEDGWAFTRLSP